MGFKLGGMTSDELGIIFLRSSKRPILPGTRDMTLTVPGRNGAWDYGADMEPRLFVLECGMITSDRFALQYAVERLARLLVDSYGRPRTLPLTFDVRPDRTYQARYSGTLDIDRITATGRFDLPMVAFEPYAMGPIQDNENVITASPYDKVIVSQGEVRTQPLIVLTNEGTTVIKKFRITNEYKLE